MEHTSRQHWLSHKKETRRDICYPMGFLTEWWHEGVSRRLGQVNRRKYSIFINPGLILFAKIAQPKNPSGCEQKCGEICYVLYRWELRTGKFQGASAQMTGRCWSSELQPLLISSHGPGDSSVHLQCLKSPCNRIARKMLFIQLVVSQGQNGVE